MPQLAVDNPKGEKKLFERKDVHLLVLRPILRMIMNLVLAVQWHILGHDSPDF